VFAGAAIGGARKHGIETMPANGST